MRNRLSYMHLPVTFLPSPSLSLTAYDMMKDLGMDLSRMPQLKYLLSPFVSLAFSRTHLEEELKHFQDRAKQFLLGADLSTTIVWSLVPSCEILHSFVINHILLSNKYP